MKIEFQKITVRNLAEGYQNNIEDGSVVAYGGKLDVRPPYQREFVYKDGSLSRSMDKKWAFSWLIG